MGVNIVALLWGAAEASLFFIVPDVWLSFAGRDKLEKGLRACLYALTGALLGGAIMYGWGYLHADSALHTLEKIPGVHPAMIHQAAVDLELQGGWAILKAPLKGCPYKIYAVQSAGYGMPILWLLLISIPARLIRFLGSTVLIHYCLRFLPGCNTPGRKLTVLILGWIVFYTAYFIQMNGS